MRKSPFVVRRTVPFGPVVLVSRKFQFSARKFAPSPTTPTAQATSTPMVIVHATPSARQSARFATNEARSRPTELPSQ
jgi:hypothetical protein